MPQLIQGRMKFTDEDYIMMDFEEKANTMFSKKSVEQLINRINHQTKMMKDITNRKVEYDETYHIILQDYLTNTLLFISSIANKQGYNLNELMKINPNE